MWMLLGSLLSCCPEEWRANSARASEISPSSSTSETPKCPTRFSGMSARMTESAKARWRWRKIWGFGRTRETAALGEGLSISCFQVPETEGRGQLRKLTGKGSDWFRSGKLRLRQTDARFRNPLDRWEKIKRQIEIRGNSGERCE